MPILIWSKAASISARSLAAIGLDRDAFPLQAKRVQRIGSQPGSIVLAWERDVEVLNHPITFKDPQTNEISFAGFVRYRHDQVRAVDFKRLLERHQLRRLHRLGGPR